MSNIGILGRSMSSNIAKIGSRSQALSFLYHPLQSRDNKGNGQQKRSIQRGKSSPQLDHSSVKVPVRAGSSEHHLSPVSVHNSIALLSRRRRTHVKTTNPRLLHPTPYYSTITATISTDPYRNEYLSLVDFYGHFQDSSIGDHLPIALPQLSRDSTASRLEVANLKFTSQDDCAMKDLNEALDNEDATHEIIYDLYQALPSPGVSSLSSGSRRRLLQRLSSVEKKNERSMIRFLSVIDDMKAAGYCLTVSEWSSVIAFAGRCFATVSAADVESALHSWKEMELSVGVQSTNVTFNILFDIATKAGKFVLAQMILKEMAARNLELNRYGRVGLIYYHGLRGDGDGVRSAYRELVEAGEIVDTVVMNCVIVSLIQAGELPAAEQTFERMKRIYVKKTGAKIPSPHWKAAKELGRMLDRSARHLRNQPEKRQRLQDEQSLAPNLQTYLILVEHHVVRTGELQRVALLINEMQFFGLPMHGRIFVKLFKGFANHGGIRYTSWTRTRLESVWTSLYIALDEESADVHLSKWIVVWALKAFHRCCGKERSLEIWEALASRWKPGEDDVAVVQNILDQILKAESGD